MIIKNEKEIEILREGGKILAGILEKLTSKVKPRVTTGDLEKLACDLIKRAGGRPSFKGFKSMHEAGAFPTAICASINEEIVHAPALPSRFIKSGDIIGIDVGMEYPYNDKENGYYTDVAVTVPVGEVSKEVKKLVEVTEKSLKLAINQVKPGNNLSDIGRAVQTIAEANGFSVVRDLVGHGVGNAVHEDPQVPNYEIKDNSIKNVVLKPGMVIAIEPMINIGGYEIKSMPDGFTIVTADRSLSAHFEHTVAVTKGGCIVITEI